MEYKKFINLVGQRKQTVFIITAVFLIVASIITFVQPLKYSATSTLLVVQNYGMNTDAYNVSRSNQFLSNLLAQVVYSDSFFEKVMSSGYNIDESIFSSDINKRKKQWQKMVYTRAVADTGTIVLKVYHQNKAVADSINQAIAYTLMTKNSQYHGLGDNVKVKIIDNSTLSDLPVKPNVALNLLLGLIVGLSASLYFIYLFPDKSLGFRRRQRKEAQSANNFNWSEPEIKSEPAAIYNQPKFEEENEEEIDEDDEFETFSFKGNINNVIKK